MKNITINVGTMFAAVASVFIAVIVAGASIVITQQMIAGQQEDRLFRAVDECLTKSKYTISSPDGSSVSEVPVEETTNKCLELKNIK